MVVLLNEYIAPGHPEEVEPKFPAGRLFNMMLNVKIGACRIVHTPGLLSERRYTGFLAVFLQVIESITTKCSPL